MATQRPLVIATDETVLDEILRVAAVAGCELDREPDLVAARARWAHAPLVVLDEEAAIVRVGLRRRAGVLLVCKGTPGEETWRRAVAVGADKVVRLPDGEDELIAAFADVVDGPAGPPGPVIAVVGGRGGAGASVLAAAVALEAVRSSPALLVDCDPLGGGLDLLLGLEKTEGLRWPEVRLTGRVSIPRLVEALPSSGALPVLSCGSEGAGPSPDALSAVVTAGRRAGRTVVCDLPRSLGEGAVTVSATADLVVLVVPQEFRACMAAKQVLRRLSAHSDHLAVVASGRSITGASPAKTAALLGPPLLATLPPERRLAESLETGEFALHPRGPLTTTARAILAAAQDHAPVSPGYAAA
ncbi:septum site-determining protein Ssd [Amycolatopsis sp. PS_44_ISF1]|uniref:septum site-determining protein Ssd n=1 Tax=Amycolatopsis sp. PS_44_ISF1 TaxID=2974917 RepID=UPI0028E07670|nr:septum site-determining protein Ssd [Amycolatopsis sp. PS_44_ISF1]MDT8910876.1 helicase [Amycolatopsis sp. PS_44_ISF1]